MRMIHTPLGRLRSNKKFIAGAAALALVGGIAPALISNSHAEEAIYTTVGPDFYTIMNNALDYYDVSRIYIEDTSIADWYDESWECEAEYSCIQGKTVGETEIVVVRNTESNLYIPLKSVQLNSKAYYAHDNRSTVERTASLTGASNSLLSIYDWDDYGDGNGEFTRTGAASYRISSNNIENENDFYITWQIGNQLVGGGTEVLLAPFEGHDLISHNEENEEILKNAAVSLIEENEDVTSLSYDGWVEDSKGNSAYSVTFTDDELRNFLNNVRTGAPYARGATLMADEYIPESAADKQETINMVFEEDVTDARFLTTYAHIGNCVSLLSGADYFNDLDPEDGIATYDEKSGRVCMNAAYIEELAEPVTISLDTDFAEPVEDGFERTWYVYENIIRKAVSGPRFTPVEFTYNEENDTLDFETTVFGAVAYGYIDKEVEDEPVDEPTDEPKEDTPAVPNTGSTDKVVTTAVATFLPLMAIAAFSFVARAKKRAANKLAKKFNHFE